MKTDIINIDIIITHMKSKQSLFQQIISVSTRKVRERSVAGAKDQFELRLKSVPKIKQLNACPYMFIFDALISFPEEVDFVLIQYQKMIEETFLNPQLNSQMLVQHFRNNLNNHSFRIIQILMAIKDPNLQFMDLFFEIHNTVAMPENVLETFRFTGYKWLSRAFGFRQCSRPSYIDGLTSGILKVEDRNLPTSQDEQRSRVKYIEKILNNITITIQNNLKAENQKVLSKQGFCFMCSKPADYYCKDTKIPVCSPACKIAHFNFINNNQCLDFQYTEKFKNEIQKLLFTNLKRKKNVSISIDYLCSIYLNSQFVPKQSLPHKDLLTVPIIAQRIWVLYTMFHLRRNQIFEHIYADCLKSKVDYICINSAKYFLKIVQTNRIIQIYQYLDCQGFRRILPTVLANLHDEQYKLKLIYCLIDRIYESEESKNIAGVASELQKQSSIQSTLLRAINYQKNPIKNFKQVYGESDSIQQMIKFIIKNEEQVNKNKICDIIFTDDKTCQTFLEELLLCKSEIIQNGEKKILKRMKSSPFADEILRQIFYFLNIKISDKIYHLLEVLDNVLNLKQFQPSNQPNQLQVVFGQENTSTKDTMFQFFYLILMIVTELNQANDKNSKDKDKKKVTQTEFLVRVKNFDPKFANNKKDYIIAVYHRLNEQPFSQDTRGVLMKYPHVQKINQSKNTFHPVRILLDNWQTIFECLSNGKNQAILLYRCCSSLVKFPTICQPFFQLLLNKVTNEQPNQSSNKNHQGSQKRASETIEKEENLLLYINNILQFEPNCIGHSSWEYLFIKDPNPKNSSQLYLFELSSLIYHSSLLTLSNFIWFVKYFCSAIKISENMAECLKLAESNYKKSSQGVTNQQKARIKIIEKQYVTLFLNEKNVYYQVQFMKGIFDIGFYELAIIYLDVLQINMVSEPLIINAIVDVVQANWAKIEAYKDEQKQKDPKIMSQDLISQQSSHRKNDENNKNLNSQNSVLSNKIWQHILNKAITIGIQKPYLLSQLAQFLYLTPQLHPYFEHLIIQHAIQSAMEGKLIIIDQILTKKLERFQKHILQMHTAKFSIIQRGDGTGRALLDQFVHEQNIEWIIIHFKYFWEIEQVYTIMTNLIIHKIKFLNKPNANEELQAPNPNLNAKSYAYILKILEQNNYINLMKLQSRYQAIIGYVSVLVYLLELQIGLSKQDKNSPNSEVLSSYTKQLEIIVNEVIMINIDPQTIKQYSQSLQSQDQNAKQKLFNHFSYLYNILSAYLTPLYISTIQTQLQFTLQPSKILQKGFFLSSSYKLQKISSYIRHINSDFRYRCSIFLSYSQIYGITDPHAIFQGMFKLPPGLPHQELMTDLLIMFSVDRNNDLNKKIICNWSFLLAFLQQNLAIYKKTLEMCQKNKAKKPKIHHNHSTAMSQAIPGQSSSPVSVSSTSLQYKPTSNSSLAKEKIKEESGVLRGQIDQHSLQHEEQHHQQELYNQKISYMKKSLKNIEQILEIRIEGEKDDKIIGQINNLLVEYIELGFDYYNPTKKFIEFSHHHPEDSRKAEEKKHESHPHEQRTMYKIYKILNRRK